MNEPLDNAPNHAELWRDNQEFRSRITEFETEVEWLQGVVAEERLRWQKNEAEVERLREENKRLRDHWNVTHA